MLHRLLHECTYIVVIQTVGGEYTVSSACVQPECERPVSGVAYIVKLAVEQCDNVGAGLVQCHLHGIGPRIEGSLDAVLRNPYLLIGDGAAHIFYALVFHFLVSRNHNHSPPTVSFFTRTVGIPQDTGTDCPLPQVQAPLSMRQSLPTATMSLRA